MKKKALALALLLLLCLTVSCTAGGAGETAKLPDIAPDVRFTNTGGDVLYVGMSLEGC